MTATVHSWLVEPLPPDVARSIGRLAASDDVEQVAVMPDVHLAGEVCVGVAVGTESLLYPEAVGGDIGCGMAAVAFDEDPARPVDLAHDRQAAAALLAGLGEKIPILRHAPRARLSLPPELARRPMSSPALDSLLRRTGALEHGTVGRGNHFLELQQGDDGRLWLMLHSGSRALGPAVRDHHVAAASQSESGLRYLEADSDAGRAFLGDLEVAMAFAESSRRAMADAAIKLVERILGARADPSSWISCHHNHVRRENHLGRELWVHRKGAIPAAADERGIIPGSMGSPSYHTAGRGLPESLGSSSHGAGRALPRGEARRRISAREVERQLDGVWFDHRRADALRDEAPAAYKDVRRVMRVQHDLTRVVRTLQPLLVYKGG